MRYFWAFEIVIVALTGLITVLTVRRWLFWLIQVVSANLLLIGIPPHWRARVFQGVARRGQLDPVARRCLNMDMVQRGERYHRSWRGADPLERILLVGAAQSLQ